MGFTERVARACAAHPGRTFAAWGLALLAAILALVFPHLEVDGHAAEPPAAPAQPAE